MASTNITDVIWPNKVQNITDFVNFHLIPNHGELDGYGKCTIFRVTVYLFELAFDTVIVE